MTKKQLKDLFGFNEKAVIEMLQHSSENEDLSSVTYIAIDKKFEIQEKYIEKLRSFAKFKSVTMGPKVADKINKYASKHTSGMIDNVISPADIDSETRMILVNCVYFKADWAEKFQKRATKKKEFTQIGGTKVELDIMHMEHKFRYSSNDKFQFVSLPYKNGCSMNIILPIEVGSPVNATLEDFESLSKSMKIANVDLYLPKFTQKYSFDEKSLVKFGCDSLFSESCDLTGISEEKLFVDSFIQKTMVIVDEEGTEAASVSRGAVKKCISARVEDVEFKANHTFVYIICDDDGKFLFIGQYDASGR